MGLIPALLRRQSSRGTKGASHQTSEKTICRDDAGRQTTPMSRERSKESLDAVAVVHQSNQLPERNDSVAEKGNDKKDPEKTQTVHPKALRSRARPPKTSENHLFKRSGKVSLSRSQRSPSFSSVVLSLMKLSRRRKKMRHVSVIPAAVECVSLDPSQEGFEAQLGKGKEGITFSGARGDFVDEYPRHEMRPKDLPKHILTKHSVDILVSEQQLENYRKPLKRGGTCYIRILPNVHIVPIDSMSFVTHDTYLKYGDDNAEIPKEVKKTQEWDDEMSAVTGTTYSTASEGDESCSRPSAAMVSTKAPPPDICATAADKTNRLLSTICCLYGYEY